jgi:hypothetical protein
MSKGRVGSSISRLDCMAEFENSHDLARKLNNITLGGEEDLVLWKWSKNRSFAVKSVYEHLTCYKKSLRSTRGKCRTNPPLPATPTLSVLPLPPRAPSPHPDPPSTLESPRPQATLNPDAAAFSPSLMLSKDAGRTCPTGSSSSRHRRRAGHRPLVACWVPHHPGHSLTWSVGKTRPRWGKR